MSNQPIVVWVVPENRSVVVGDEVVATVWISVPSLRVLDAVVYYNPTVLSYVSDSVIGMKCDQYVKHHNEPGDVWVICESGTDAGARHGPILTIRFKARTPGKTTLELLGFVGYERGAGGGVIERSNVVVTVN
jgi:hypothetical protein